MPAHREFQDTIVGTPPEGWTVGHVSVKLRDGNRLTVEAWRRGAFAVHEVNIPDHGARLTHSPTGLQIWTFDTMDDAAECAESIEQFTDWTVIKEMMPWGTDLAPKVREVIDRIDGCGAVAH